MSALFAMPVHRGSRTKVHLVSTDLRSTTTDEPSNKKAPNVSEHVSNVEQTLKDGHVLRERNIPLVGDDNPLHLLGGDEYMPFLFVRAGEDMRPVVSGHLTPRFTLVHLTLVLSLPPEKSEFFTRIPRATLFTQGYLGQIPQMPSRSHEPLHFAWSFPNSPF